MKSILRFFSSQCPDEEHVECKIDDHATMSVYCIPLNTQLLYSETGVYRGIHYPLIVALKHRLWVLVEAVLTCSYNLCFEQT